MSVSELSTSAQNYLKTIWTLSEWSDIPVSAKLIAEKTGLKLSTVSDGVRKLTDQGLLEHAPYGSVALTELGHKYAVMMVRRHRLIESFLVTVLGYSWDQVHDEAEVLEHSVSDFMIDQMDRYLDYPKRDPHGDPIPSVDGNLVSLDASPLSRSDAGTTVTVQRISDDDPELLQFFEGLGVNPGSRLVISSGPAFSDSVEMTIEGEDAAALIGARAMAALFVSPAQG